MSVGWSSSHCCSISVVYYLAQVPYCLSFFCKIKHLAIVVSDPEHPRTFLVLVSACCSSLSNSPMYSLHFSSIFPFLFRRLFCCSVFLTSSLLWCYLLAFDVLSLLGFSFKNFLRTDIFLWSYGILKSCL